MITINTQDDLRVSLDALETALSTPIVAGELAAWTKEVQQAWCDVSEQIHIQMTDVHPRQFQQISKEDPEMLSRVEKLKAEDQEIEQDRDGLGRQIARIAEHAPKFEPDEEKLQSHTSALAEAGVALVHRARKQEVALQTWFTEAFNRDRGVAG